MPVLEDSRHQDIGEEEILEEDEEERIGTNASAQTIDDKNSCKVIYDIMLSPSYQVPVLYLQTGLSSTAHTGIHLPDIVTPGLMRPQLRNAGIIGALTLTVSEPANLKPFSTAAGI